MFILILIFLFSLSHLFLLFFLFSLSRLFLFIFILFLTFIIILFLFSLSRSFLFLFSFLFSLPRLFLFLFFYSPGHVFSYSYFHSYSPYHAYSYSLCFVLTVFLTTHFYFAFSKSVLQLFSLFSILFEFYIKVTSIALKLFAKKNCSIILSFSSIVLNPSENRV